MITTPKPIDTPAYHGGVVQCSPEGPYCRNSKIVLLCCEGKPRPSIHPSSLLAMSALQRALLRVLYERSGRGRMSQEQPGTPVTQAPRARRDKEQVDAGAVCRFCFGGATYLASGTVLIVEHKNLCTNCAFGNGSARAPPVPKRIVCNV